MESLPLFGYARLRRSTLHDVLSGDAAASHSRATYPAHLRHVGNPACPDRWYLHFRVGKTAPISQAGCLFILSDIHAGRAFGWARATCCSNLCYQLTALVFAASAVWANSKAQRLVRAGGTGNWLRPHDRLSGGHAIVAYFAGVHPYILYRA